VREQFFIDALAMILSETLSNEELKLYDKRNKNIAQEGVINVDYEKLSDDGKESKADSIKEIQEQSKNLFQV